MAVLVKTYIKCADRWWVQLAYCKLFIYREMLAMQRTTTRGDEQMWITRLQP